MDESKVNVVARFEAAASRSPNILAAGQSAVVQAELEEGKYVLICNLNATGGARRRHYDEGMRTGFRVGDD